MNPNVNSSPGLHLPEPLPAGPNGHEQQPEQGVGAEFVAVAAPETAPRPGAPTFAAPQMPDPQSQTSATPTAAATPIPATPVAAADDDLIEREWVDKAKQIVDGTKEDPYQQNRQLAAFKADYMKKRYGKTIKLSE